MELNYDYAGMGEWLRGSECLQLVRERTDLARVLYQTIVARDSGDLAESARVSMSRGQDGRHQGVVTVGDIDTVYAASHEFGTQYHNPEDDLTLVLGMLGTM